MWRQRSTFAVLAALTHCLSQALAHPGSGIEVDERGGIFFTDTMRGLWRIDPGDKLTLVQNDGLHWIAIDRRGSFAQSPDKFDPFARLTPKGEKPTIVACYGSPCVIGRDGNLYWPKNHSLTIMRRTPQGKESVLVEKDTFKMAGDIGVPGIACGPDGALYLVALDSFNRVDGKGQHVIWTVTMDGAIARFAEGFVTAKDRLPKAEQHPEVPPQYCRGLAVNETGDVYVTVTGNRCVMKLTAKRETSVVHRTRKPWIPTGVAVFKDELYVLEYDDETPAKHGEWPPRVKKVGRDGKVTLLADVKRDNEE